MSSFSNTTPETQSGLNWQAYPKTPRQPRSKPMAVLCLGLSRTGTMSTYAGLRQLGYNCYHFAEAGCDLANGSLEKWREAVEAKYYNGNPRKRLETAEDFDEMLWRYDATTDMPTVHFAEELIKAYPEAKVILTERDPDSWVRSIDQVFIGVIRLKIWRFLEYVDREYAYNFMKLMRYSLDIWSPGYKDICDHEALRQGYLEYNARIKRIVPKERFLIWHPRDGWEPICRHLGKPVPETPFPNINDGQRTYDMFALYVWKMRLVAAAQFWAKRLGPVVIAVVGLWLWRR